MQSSRKFTITRYSITVVSDGPYNPTRLRQIPDDIASTRVAGTWGTEKVETIDAQAAATLLARMDRDPATFGLAPDGSDAPPPSSPDQVSPTPAVVTVTILPDDVILRKPPR